MDIPVVTMKKENYGPECNGVTSAVRSRQIQLCFWQSVFDPLGRSDVLWIKVQRVDGAAWILCQILVNKATMW